MPHRYAVISCSLSPRSRSRILAAAAAEHWRENGTDVDFIDLVDFPLPLCDGAAAYGDPNAKQIKERLLACHGYLLAVPIYNFDINAAAKNLIELTGRDVWTGKVAGFLCAAGGRASYMSVMSIASSLMLDFRTVIVPRFVYTEKHDFENDRIATEEVARRVHELADEVARFAEALVSV